MRGIIAVVVALCLSACAAETQDNPIRALARALGVGKASCLGEVPGGFQRAYEAEAKCNIAVQRGQPSFDNSAAPRTRLQPQPLTLNASERTSSSAQSNIADAIPDVVPSLNIEASCHYAAEAAIDRNVNRCLSDERSARDQLARRWSDFPPSYRLHCARYASRGGGGTYTDLLTCVEMDVHAHELSERGRQKDQAAN